MKKILTTVAFSLFAIPALADSAPPEEFTMLRGLEPSGEFEGMNVWSTQFSDLIWMKNDVSGEVFAGFLFDKDGHIINESREDFEEITLDQFIESHVLASGIPLPAQDTDDIEKLLSLLDEDTRVELVGRLIEILRDVSTEEDFNIAAAAWVDELRETAIEATAEDGEGLNAIDQAQSDMAKAPNLFAALAEADWIQIGEDDAPILYMLTDPACEPCVEEWKSAAKLAEDGVVQLRLALIAGVSEDSIAIASGILQSNDVESAMNGIAYDGELPIGLFNMLPEERRDGLRNNFRLASVYQIEQVPLFAWDNGGDGEYQSEAPDAEVFRIDDAIDLPDEEGPVEADNPYAHIQHLLDGDTEEEGADEDVDTVEDEQSND